MRFVASAFRRPERTLVLLGPVTVLETLATLFGFFACGASLCTPGLSTRPTQRARHEKHTQKIIPAHSLA